MAPSVTWSRTQLSNPLPGYGSVAYETQTFDIGGAPVKFRMLGRLTSPPAYELMAVRADGSTMELEVLEKGPREQATVLRDRATKAVQAAVVKAREVGAGKTSKPKVLARGDVESVVISAAEKFGLTDRKFSESAGIFSWSFEAPTGKSLDFNWSPDIGQLLHREGGEIRGGRLRAGGTDEGVRSVADLRRVLEKILRRHEAAFKPAVDPNIAYDEAVKVLREANPYRNIDAKGREVTNLEMWARRLDAELEKPNNAAVVSGVAEKLREEVIKAGAGAKSQMQVNQAAVRKAAKDFADSRGLKLANFQFGEMTGSDYQWAFEYPREYSTRALQVVWFAGGSGDLSVQEMEDESRGKSWNWKNVKTVEDMRERVSMALNESRKWLMGEPATATVAAAMPEAKPGTKIYLQGTTYPQRIQLRQAGFRWDRDRKAWWTDKPTLAQSMAQSLGARVETTDIPASPPKSEPKKGKDRLAPKVRESLDKLVAGLQEHHYSKRPHLYVVGKKWAKVGPESSFHPGTLAEAFLFVDAKTGEVREAASFKAPKDVDIGVKVWDYNPLLQPFEQKQFGRKPAEPEGRKLGVGREDYEERKEARIERLEERAAKKKAEAEARWQASGERASRIPMGQPILKGHHSEKRHRRDIERIQADSRKSVEARREAEELERRAAAAEASGAISSDDPKALEKLQKKLAYMEAQREQIKRFNRLARKGDQEAISRIAKYLGPSASYHKPEKGYPAYVLTNLGGNIRRVKERIQELETRAQRTARQTEIGDWEIVENPDVNRTQMQTRDGRRATEEEKKALKSYGFRWSRNEGAWQRQISNAAWSAAESVAKISEKAGGMSKFAVTDAQRKAAEALMKRAEPFRMYGDLYDRGVNDSANRLHDFLGRADGRSGVDTFMKELRVRVEAAEKSRREREAKEKAGKKKPQRFNREARERAASAAQIDACPAALYQWEMWHRNENLPSRELRQDVQRAFVPVLKAFLKAKKAGEAAVKARRGTKSYDTKVAAFKAAEKSYQDAIDGMMAELEWDVDFEGEDVVEARKEIDRCVRDTAGGEARARAKRAADIEAMRKAQGGLFAFDVPKPAPIAVPRPTEKAIEKAAAAEQKEHPWATKAQARQIAKDHLEGEAVFVGVFDALKPKQVIEAALLSPMSSSRLLDGTFHRYVVGRRSSSKKYGTTTIRITPEGSKQKFTKHNALTLTKRKSKEGGYRISAGQGNMALTLKGLRIPGVVRVEKKAPEDVPFTPEQRARMDAAAAQVRAAHEARQEVTDVANKAFDAGFRESMKKASSKPKPKKAPSKPKAKPAPKKKAPSKPKKPTRVAKAKRKEVSDKQLQEAMLELLRRTPATDPGMAKHFGISLYKAQKTRRELKAKVMRVGTRGCHSIYAAADPVKGSGAARMVHAKTTCEVPGVPAAARKAKRRTPKKASTPKKPASKKPASKAKTVYYA
jgi:hypothetical protein